MNVLRVSWGVLAVSGMLVACGGDGGGRDGGPGPGVDAQMVDAPITPTDAPITPTDSPMTTRMCTAGGACDIANQSTCPAMMGAQQACHYAAPSMGAMPTTLCTPAGTGTDNDPCTNIEDCQAGFTCSADGVCRHYCCMGASSDCPAGTGQICIQFSGAMGIGICTPVSGCTLAPQAGCDAGEGCWPVAEDGSTGCFPAGTVAEGGACDALNDCTAGFGCFTPAMGTAQCIGFCRIGMDSDCSGGRMCRMVTGVGLPAGIGLCLAM